MDAPNEKKEEEEKKNWHGIVGEILNTQRDLGCPHFIF
jgi:hypothetical protein